MYANLTDSNNPQQPATQNDTDLHPLSLPDPFPPFPGMLSGDVLISRKVFNTIEMVINVYIINALSIIGSAGNIMSIIILFIHGFKSSTNVVLVSLAIADLMLVLTMPLRKVSLIIGQFDLALAITVENYITRYNFLTLNRIWSLISNTHIAIISVERVLAVYFPFQVGRWVTVPRMTILVVLTHIVWYLALFPLFTMFELGWVRHPLLNETVAIHRVTPFYLERESIFNDYYSYSINISAGAFLLIFTLMCCVAIMIKILKTGKKRRKLITGSCKMTRSSYPDVQSEGNGNGIEIMVATIQKPRNSQTSEPENQNTPGAYKIDIKALRMLMTVCITFLVLIFPTFFLPLFQGIFPKLRSPYWRHVNFLATSGSMLLITINSSVNFIIYIILSSKFHRTFVYLCSCGEKKKSLKIDTGSFPKSSIKKNLGT